MTFEEPEGATPLNPDERQGLKYDHVTTRLELDELEQANIEQGLTWVSRRRRGSIFDDEFIRLLHRQLFGDVWQWAGEYRKTEKNLGVEPHRISTEVRILLDDARFWKERGVYLPLEAAARFHHRMVQIHPFPNGNGRHARIATDILLEEALEHPPIAWASGVDLQADNLRRKAYIRALRAADGGELEPLLRFVGAHADPR